MLRKRGKAKSLEVNENRQTMILDNMKSFMMNEK